MFGMQGMDASLRRRRAFLESRDSAEALSRLGGVCDRFSLERERPGDFLLTIRGVEINGSAIVNVASGTPIGLCAEGARGRYRILLPLRRGCDKAVSEQDVGDGKHHAAIVSPDREHAVFSEHDSERLWLFIDEAAVTRTATALLGEAVDPPVQFEPDIDLRRREIGDLFSAVTFAAQQLGDESSLFSSPWLRAELERMIIIALLLGQPHNYSDRLARPDRRSATRDVMRAVDFIHGHLDAPITLADLVAAAGVPGRTLRQHFQRAHGMSPMAYLRKARYEHARTLLLTEPRLSVTEAALRAGCDHFGRFAAGYRQRFGESPSQTVARREQRDR